MSTKPIFSMDNNFHAVLSTKWGGLFNKIQRSAYAAIYLSDPYLNPFSSLLQPVHSYICIYHKLPYLEHLKHIRAAFHLATIISQHVSEPTQRTQTPNRERVGVGSGHLQPRKNMQDYVGRHRREDNSEERCRIPVCPGEAGMASDCPAR